MICMRLLIIMITGLLWTVFASCSSDTKSDAVDSENRDDSDSAGDTDSGTDAAYEARPFEPGGECVADSQTTVTGGSESCDGIGVDWNGSCLSVAGDAAGDCELFHVTSATVSSDLMAATNSHLYFFEEHDGQYSLVRVDANTRNVDCLMGFGGIKDVRGVLIEGDRLFTTVAKADSDYHEIISMNLDGSDARILSEEIELAGDFKLKSSGNMLHYQRKEDGYHTDVRSIPLEGGPETTTNMIDLWDFGVVGDYVFFSDAAERLRRVPIGGSWTDASVEMEEIEIRDFFLVDGVVYWTYIENIEPEYLFKFLSFNTATGQFTETEPLGYDESYKRYLTHSKTHMFIRKEYRDEYGRDDRAEIYSIPLSDGAARLIASTVSAGVVASQQYLYLHHDGGILRIKL